MKATILSAFVKSLQISSAAFPNFSFSYSSLAKPFTTRIARTFSSIDSLRRSYFLNTLRNAGIANFATNIRPKARTGILDGNPVHEDMLWAAQTAKLAFIVNVVLNAEKKPIFAVSGDTVLAHKAGTDFLSKYCGVEAQPADIAITTNGGYPLDQNTYQAAKGMTAGEATVKEGGVVIMLSESQDGTGGDHFFKVLADSKTVDEAMGKVLARGRNQTVPDQWQAQIILRVLQKARVIYVSTIDDETVERMHMIPAHSLKEAMDKAKTLVGVENPSVVAIPDGIAVMAR